MVARAASASAARPSGASSPASSSRWVLAVAVSMSVRRLSATPEIVPARTACAATASLVSARSAALASAAASSARGNCTICASIT